MNNKKLDIIIYGATGFTGSLCVKYFKENYPGINWGIAGRNQNKLQNLCQLYSLNCKIIIADAGDSLALDKLTKQTKVVLSTAGPFYRYGTNLVESCIKNQTHYVDITGETGWIKELISKYHEEAKQKSIRIVPSCGFDSIPSDLGSLFAQRNYEKPIKSIDAFYKWKGEASGGTIETMFSLIKNKKSFSNPFILNPKNSVSVFQKSQTLENIRIKKNSSLNIWSGPFIMGPTNSSIVRRSAALLYENGDGYSKDFIYQESAYYSNKWSAYLRTFLLVVFILSILTPLNKIIRLFLKKPGQGPSIRVMNEGFFKVKFIIDNNFDDKAIFEIFGKGDPGYKITSLLVCESALSLLEDKSIMPGGKDYGGILTPSSGLGDVLIKRLINAGISFKKIS